MGNRKIRKMSKMLRLLPLLFVSSMLLFASCTALNSPEESTLLSLLPDNSYRIKMLYCPEADACLVSLVGENSILGNRVILRIGDYQVPSIHNGMCALERLKGYKASTFLQELFNSSKVAILINAHKQGLDPSLRGDILIDGRDVTVMMFEMNIAVPKGIKVDWCETIGRRLEI